MSRLVASEFVSLDGVMEKPEAWVFDFPDPEQARYKLDEVLACDALLLGRRTYEEFARAWPSRTGAFADRMNGMTKHVVSTTLRDLEWSNSALIASDVPGRVAELKERSGGDILLVGSRRLLNALTPEGLIDEYRLIVFPIVLGRGERLFDEPAAATTLRLADCTPLASGTVILTYGREAGLMPS